MCVWVGGGGGGGRVEIQIVMMRNLPGWESAPTSLVDILQHNIYFKDILMKKLLLTCFIIDITIKNTWLTFWKNYGALQPVLC